MDYQVIEFESLTGTQKHIVVDRGDGSFVSFPVDETNPTYVAWLSEQENKEN